MARLGRLADRPCRTWTGVLLYRPGHLRTVRRPSVGWPGLPAVCACLPLPRPAFRVRSLSCAGPAPADARRAHAVISGRF